MENSGSMHESTSRHQKTRRVTLDGDHVLSIVENEWLIVAEFDGSDRWERRIFVRRHRVTGRVLVYGVAHRHQSRSARRKDALRAGVDLDAYVHDDIVNAITYVAGAIGAKLGKIELPSDIERG